MSNGLGYVSKYDPNLGYRVKRPIIVRSGSSVGEGIGHVFKTIVKPLVKTTFKAVGKTAKEGTKTLAKKALLSQEELRIKKNCGRG